MISDIQDVPILFFQNIKQSFLCMAVFGIYMKDAHILLCRKHAPNFGKISLDKINNGIFRTSEH